MNVLLRWIGVAAHPDVQRLNFGMKSGYRALHMNQTAPAATSNPRSRSSSPVRKGTSGYRIVHGPGGGAPDSHPVTPDASLAVRLSSSHLKNRRRGRRAAAAQSQCGAVSTGARSLEASRGPEEVLDVLKALIEWLRTPEQASLRRAFTVWFRRVFLPRRLPGVDLANMEPGEALLDSPDGAARVQALRARDGA
jgi:hypothetical protein